MPTNSEIYIRDPFVLPVEEERQYYLFGTTDRTCWGDAPGVGFDCYQSSDLKNWEGPIPAFRKPEGFWADKQFWAPEVHAYRDRYFMLATFKRDAACRGTQILVSDRPEGIYRIHSDGPVTPRDWECLDGTLFVDDSGKPWMVFCHEWLQIVDGSIAAMPLKEDLSASAGEPVELFHASEAPWTMHTTRPEWPDRKNFVTDGPFLHRMTDGGLTMLWSSFAGDGEKRRYAMGQAWSESGGILGPWIQEPRPLIDDDAGHGMVFRAFDGRLMSAVHAPNAPHGDERPVFRQVEEAEGGLVPIE